jgi:hypothetical protein
MLILRTILKRVAFYMLSFVVVLCMMATAALFLKG